MVSEYIWRIDSRTTAYTKLLQWPCRTPGCEKSTLPVGGFCILRVFLLHVKLKKKKKFHMYVDSCSANLYCSRVYCILKILNILVILNLKYMGEANIKNVDVKMLGEQLLEFPPPFLGNWSSAIFFFP